MDVSNGLNRSNDAKLMVVVVDVKSRDVPKRRKETSCVDPTGEAKCVPTKDASKDRNEMGYAMLMEDRWTAPSMDVPEKPVAEDGASPTGAANVVPWSIARVGSNEEIIAPFI